MVTDFWYEVMSLSRLQNPESSIENHSNIPSVVFNKDFTIDVIPGLTRNPIFEAGFPLQRE